MEWGVGSDNEGMVRECCALTQSGHLEELQQLRVDG